jgi:UDP-N-acetylmuramoyl-tripeptide--D-alanyl-D-alanine ligase
MKLIIFIAWIILLTKNLFFWVWLWQLKEYHLGRFKAHFEVQRVKKIIASFLILRFPRLTKKTALVVLTGIAVELLISLYAFSLKDSGFYYFLLIVFILSPLLFSFIVLFFQLPTLFVRKLILKKAKEKIKRFPELLVIGITGSYGKTSTKEFLAEVLSKKFNVLKTEKHINAEIGIAQTILKNLKSNHEIFVVEIGAYQKGKIKEVCSIIKPKIGILTGITQQHLSTFGSRENIIKAKFELIESLPESGIAFFNATCDLVKLALKEKGKDLKVKRRILCSTKEKLDFWAQDIKVEKEQISFRVFSRESNDSFDFELNLQGAHNIELVLLVCAVAKTLGLSWREISEAVKNLKPLEGALKLVKSKKGVDILDATYSANPQGVMAHLEHLKLWEGKKIIIMPSLIELGKESDEIHKKIGKKIGRICDLAIITTKDGFKNLKEGALEEGMDGGRIIYNPDAEEILRKIKEEAKPGDVILLESRVPQELKKSLP